MAKCLVSMYQEEYKKRMDIILQIATHFEMDYCQVAVISLLGTLTTELLKVLYSKFHEWLGYTDEMIFSSMIKFLNERLKD